MGVDSVGDIYVTGSVGAPATFGTFAVGGAGGKDIFVAKLRNADGSVVWAKSFGSPGDDTPSGIAINASGQLAVSGTIAGPLQVGGSFNGATDAVVASFSSSGASLWTRVFGTSGTDYGFNVAGGAQAFYLAFDPALDVGPTIDGVPILGTSAPAGLLLKIQP